MSKRQGGKGQGERGNILCSLAVKLCRTPLPTTVGCIKSDGVESSSVFVPASLPFFKFVIPIFQNSATDPNLETLLKLGFSNFEF